MELGSDRRIHVNREVHDATRELRTLRQKGRQAVEDHDRRGPVTLGAARGGGEGLDDMLLRHAGLIALVALVLGYKILSSGHVSAYFAHGEAPHYELREAPGIVWRVLHNPFNPAEAWEPVSTGGEVPGPGTFWITFVILVVVHILLLVVPIMSLHRAWRGRALGSRRDDGVRWADEAEMRDLLVHRRKEHHETHRVVVGRVGHSDVALNRLHSLLVVGPLHAGKTTALSIPTLLEWDGPALVVSSRGHLMDQTIGWRRQHGEVRVFDPASESRHERSGWTLLSECGTWEGAITMAQHLTAAAYGSAGGRIDGGDPRHLDHGALWGGSMAMALAPYLYAAALTGRPIMDVAAWIITQAHEELLHILYPVDEQAAQALEASFHRHDASSNAFFHYMYDLLSVYGDPGVAATATKRDILPQNLMGSRHETLYLFAPEHDQARFQPIFTVIVRQHLTAINDRFAETGKPLRHPLLLLFEGAVGVASIQAVSQMASTGTEKGVEVVTVFDEDDWTDVVQGNAAANLIDHHRAVLVTDGSWRGEDANAAMAGWPEVTHALGKGEAALFYDHRKPLKVEMRRWRHHDHLRKRAEEPERAVHHTANRPGAVRQSVSETPEHKLAETAEYKLVDQTSAWQRRRGAGHGAQGAGGDGSRQGRSGKRGLNVFNQSPRPEDQAGPEPMAHVAKTTQRYRPR